MEEAAQASFTSGRIGTVLFCAGCHDRRAINGLHDNGSLVFRSIGPAAVATAADDHDDDEDKRATNHGSLTHNRHVIPPSKET